MNSRSCAAASRLEMAARSIASSGSESFGSPPHNVRMVRLTRSPNACSGPSNACAIRVRAYSEMDMTAPKSSSFER